MRLRNALLAIGLLSFCCAANAFNSAVAQTPLATSSKVKFQTKPLTEHEQNYQYLFQVAQPEKLARKLYRKALFYYFQGQPELALRQLTYNKARLNVVDDNALLFEAGLQVSLGLYRQAEKSLTMITAKLANSSAQKSNQQTSLSNAGGRFDYFASQDLLAVALLQLAEQQINQQQQVSAQQTLAKLSHLPDGYYQQYHILSQLAFWPQPAKLPLKMPVQLDNDGMKNQQAEAYILLNTALIKLEQKDLESAEQDLITLKHMNWQAPKKSFWQQLFSSDNSSTLETTLESDHESDHEQQSLQDYASLLLAQLYVEQEQFSLAYRELANFPQNSPFTEQALFLFAYASLKTQHYPESEAVFSLLSTRYPTSYFGWQADVLLASQYLLQRDLDTALAQYLALENKYQQQLASLASFEQHLRAKPIGVTGNYISNSDKALTASVWWDKAIASVKLTGQLDQANELAALNKKIAKQQQQVQWLDYAITLNERRQAKIIAQQQRQNYQERIVKLQSSRDKLANQLFEAKTHADATVFASGQQQQWLQRISKSKSVIETMAENQHYQKKSLKYQQRLKRVEGVLVWQLQQKFPQRLWQHQTTLEQLDKLLAKLQQQLNQVIAIQQLAKKDRKDHVNTGTNTSVIALHGVKGSSSLDKNLLNVAGVDLPKLKQRQQQAAQESLQLKLAVMALGNLTNEHIQAELLLFIAQQRQSLNYYLHHSRRAMAKILEEFKKVDLANSDTLAISGKKSPDEEQFTNEQQVPLEEIIGSNTDNKGDDK